MAWWTTNAASRHQLRTFQVQLFFISNRPQLWAKPVLPSTPGIVSRIAHAFRQIVIMSDDAKKRIAYPGKHRSGRELSDAIRLFAIMAGKFYRDFGHRSAIM
jgi:hypothetical protein